MSVEIVFETHSTSTDNERGVASGWSDPPLSETGRAQARQLGARRRHGGFAVVYTSDLRRAVETTAIAFDNVQQRIVRDPRLRECDYGDLNAAPLARLEPRSRFIDTPFPNGESYRDVVRRMSSFLAELKSAERVLLIGHTATRWSLDHVVSGVPLEALVDAPFAWREGWTYRYSP